ncbi:DUF1499 domain-containing protein [Aurantimonas sp. C2-6-R+9]|uniref:DUF1499 domain-containing protein n=1 Tax=unclassified Aurantimonas TaxID=2638230 RepID=UPI002E1708C0|nr:MULTISPECIES: DUF1499 domain-containing protein [unclassified Aurantimonas]MEC5289283.1 DUF1499 domain-containing protein [Aurantimonas sp. C2-3-R2]MEC5380081.1 DUF1499 domain-containing protein [Aurantimonas sp. C2-6-R+9]MEC5410267.1 DUF1499 domain-containing protein [Aurantimonas sp. C2-4-R8]
MNETTGHRGDRPWSRTALTGFALGLGAIAGIALSGIGYRYGWWQVTTALNISTYAAYTAALGLVLSVIGLARSRPGGERRGFLVGLLGLAASLPVVAMAAEWEYATRAYPPINDVSTDIEDPPVFWDMPKPTDYPGGEVAELQRAAYPDLAPLALTVTPDQAFSLARELVDDEGWEIVAEEPEDGRIEAVAGSFLYDFKDEVIVRVTPSDDGAIVDVRSRSRTGRLDRGVNAKRIRAVLAELKERSGDVRP